MLECVHETGERDDGRSVLVIVEDRDITALLQLLLDLKAARRGDILEVYAAEASGKECNCVHDCIRVLRADAERNRVDIAEGLEQGTFSFHDRHAGLRADIAEAEDSRTVCDNGNCVPAARQLKALLRVLLDLKARSRDARRVGEAQCLGAADVRADLDLNLTLQLLVHF